MALFERAKYPIGVWQFQQGGIDIGDDIKTTLWRELKEEIGLVESDVSSLQEMPFWTVYQDPDSVKNVNKSRIGQAHKWFFLELKTTCEIYLSKAEDNEASNFKWVTFNEAISITDELKKHVYQELETYFLKYIRPTL